MIHLEVLCAYCLRLEALAHDNKVPVDCYPSFFLVHVFLLDSLSDQIEAAVVPI